MKSKPVQFCRIILYCMEHYSESTEARVGNLLNSHERVIKIYKMLESNPTEQEIGQELSAGVKEKFSLDEDLDGDYDFTDEKAGAIHDTLKYSMDEEYDDWLVNDDGKNNINDLIKEAVALETTGKTGFFYLDKKEPRIFLRSQGTNYPANLKIRVPISLYALLMIVSIILLKANNLSDGSVIGKIALQKQVER